MSASSREEVIKWALKNQVVSVRKAKTISGHFRTTAWIELANRDYFTDKIISKIGCKPADFHDLFEYASDCSLQMFQLKDEVEVIAEIKAKRDRRRQYLKLKEEFGEE